MLDRETYPQNSALLLLNGQHLHPTIFGDGKSENAFLLCLLTVYHIRDEFNAISVNIHKRLCEVFRDSVVGKGLVRGQEISYDKGGKGGFKQQVLLDPKHRGHSIVPLLNCNVIFEFAARAKMAPHKFNN
jgi:hypothetical protein